MNENLRQMSEEGYFIIIFCITLHIIATVRKSDYRKLLLLNPSAAFDSKKE
jgi:hypothetical protein